MEHPRDHGRCERITFRLSTHKNPTTGYNIILRCGVSSFTRLQPSDTSCHEAQTRAKALWHDFIKAYGIDDGKFPMLKLDPGNWGRPFSVERGGGQPAMQWDEWERLVQKTKEAESHSR